MEFESIVAASKAGMKYERLSLELASKKLALANVAFSSLEEAQKATESMNAAYEAINSEVKGRSNQPVATHDTSVKVTLDPGNPLADVNGNVYYLNVDHISEMARLVTAVRAYEANVRAYNTNSEMNASALQIGGN